MATTNVATADREFPHGRPAPAGIATVRVLHVINGQHYSGAERVQDLLAGELAPLGFEVGFACVKPDRFAQARQSLDAPLYELPVHSRFDLRPIAGLVRLVRRENYRILHAHTPRTALLASVASLITGVPLVYHVHSPASRDSARVWQNRLNALVERVCLVGASALIAVSESLGRHMRRQGFGHDRVHVVRNGVPRRIPRVCRTPGQTPWTLGVVALFRPRKGLEVLLDALAQLRKHKLPVRLLAVGGFETSDYQRRIERQVAALGLDDVIEWTGMTCDVDGQLDRMDLLVAPSLFGEGLPMVVLEAMAAGVPIVATRVEGIPEAIHDGREGLLVAPADPGALADAISRIVQGEVDWQTLRQNALSRQAACFSDTSMATSVADVYRQVLASQHLLPRRDA